jgi:hypothetical protein
MIGQTVSHDRIVGTLAVAGLAALILGSLVVVASEPGSPPEASLDPPSDAVELCTGHVTGAPLPDGRPGPHVVWTLYTSAETRRSLVERYRKALGKEGHTADAGCDSWKRPAERPGRILEVCDLTAEGPWERCPAPPKTAQSRICVSTMARAE